MQFFGQKLVIRSFLAAREDRKFHFYLGNQVFSYETERKRDEGGQLVSPGKLPSRSLEAAGGRKAYGQIPTFHPRMGQTPIEMEAHRTGWFGDQTQEGATVSTANDS